MDKPVSSGKMFFIILFLAIFALGIFAGILVGRAQILSNPACHSISEDSVINDCNYRNGAWYRK